jgi:hypothetical protein
MAETHATTTRQPYKQRFLPQKADRFRSALCDDLFHDYNAADVLINLMRVTLRLLSFRFPKSI